jgi:hypothetical protein
MRFEGFADDYTNADSSTRSGTSASSRTHSNTNTNTAAGHTKYNLRRNVARRRRFHVMFGGWRVR